MASEDMFEEILAYRMQQIRPKIRVDIRNLRWVLTHTTQGDIEVEGNGASWDEVAAGKSMTELAIDSMAELSAEPIAIRVDMA